MTHRQTPMSSMSCESILSFYALLCSCLVMSKDSILNRTMTPITCNLKDTIPSRKKSPNSLASLQNQIYIASHVSTRQNESLYKWVKISLMIYSIQNIQKVFWSLDVNSGGEFIWSGWAHLGFLPHLGKGKAGQLLYRFLRCCDLSISFFACRTVTDPIPPF